MWRTANLLNALIVARVREGVGAGQREPVKRPELAGDLDALPGRGAIEIAHAGLVHTIVENRDQHDLVLKPRVEVRHIQEYAVVPESLLPAGVPADRALGDKAGVRLEERGDEA